MASRYRALLIGNSTYPADEHNLQTLKGPVKDIATLNRALIDPTSGMFADVDVTLLPEVNSSRAIRALGAFFRNAERDDVLLFYFSGHGKLDQSGRLHLCMQDTESSDLLATALSSSRLNEFVEASRARQVVIVLDCCYAGAFRGADLGDPVAGPGRYVMTSCRSTQLANDATVENGTSYFTQHLVDGLVGAAIDSDGDGYVDFSDLYGYVDRRLRAEGKQIPLRRVDGDGDLRLARRSEQAAERPVAPPVAAPPVAAPPVAARGVPPGRHRRWLVAGVAAAVVVVAGVIALVIGLGGDGGNAAGGSDTPSGPYIRTGQQYPTTGTYTASGPWRIRLVDEIEHNNNGCDLTVSSSDTDLVVPPLQGAYELTTVQIPRAGHFQWRVNDAECQVAPAVGSGNLPLPAVVPASKGDSDAFAVSGPVTVEVKDFQGSETCRLRLVDATDGTLLDVADAKDYKATLRMDSGGAHTAYLGLDSCTVRISSG